MEQCLPRAATLQLCTRLMLLKMSSFERVHGLYTVRSDCFLEIALKKWINRLRGMNRLLLISQVFVEMVPLWASYFGF